MIKAEDSCNAVMDYIEAVNGGVLEYNARIFNSDWEKIEGPYNDYLGKSSKISDLYKAIHIDDSFKTPIYESGSEAVAEGYASDNLVDYSDYYNYMIEEDYPFIVMAGEFDMKDGADSQYTWMQKTLNVSKDFWSQDRKIYYYDGPDNSQ